MTPVFEERAIQWTPDRVQRFWGYFARSPDAPRAYFSSHSGDQLIAFVERFVRIAPGQRLLDWGCGPGFLLEKLCRRGFAAEGLEFSHDSARQAVDHCRSLPTFAGVTVADSVPTELPAQAFDAVFLIEVIEHLLPEQIDAAFTEIHRLLRPGGIFVITTPHDENLAVANTICPDCGLVFHPWQHVGSFTASALAHMVGPHGFDPICCRATAIGGRPPSRAGTFVRRLLARPAPQPHLIYIGRRR